MAKTERKIGLRDATLEEAVEIIKRCITSAEKKLQIAFFRQRQGEEFANTVERRALNGRR